MNRKRVQPVVTTSQLKRVWTGAAGTAGAGTSDKQEKKVKIFNQHATSLKGKIKLDSDTYIEYDYSMEYPITKLHKKSNEDTVAKDTFELPRYPTLKEIVSEIPKNNDEALKEMDLFLMRDMNEALLWRSKEFEFH